MASSSFGIPKSAAEHPAVNWPVCSQCTKGIAPAYVVVYLGERFHPDCVAGVLAQQREAA
jgi:hypothetical protein